MVSLNAAALLNIIKRNRVAKYLQQEKAGLICIQETHLETSESKLFRHLFKGMAYHALSELRSGGVLLGIGHKVPWVLMVKILDPGGRYAILKGKLDSRTVVLVGLYVPNQQQAAFWDSLLADTEQCNHSEVVAIGVGGGGVNAVLDNALDRTQESSTPELSKKISQA